MPDSQTNAPQPPQTNAQLLAAAEENLAAYHYLSAAAWAYQFQQRGITLPPHLQQVLDEEHYDPEAPVSTGSTFHLSPQRIAQLQTKAEHGDRAAAKRLREYYALAAPQSAATEQAAAYWAARADTAPQP